MPTYTNTVAAPATATTTATGVTYIMVPILPQAQSVVGQHQVVSPQKPLSSGRQFLSGKKCCGHNEWDNVRVAKGCMTLRCRVCQKQWRADVDLVWNGLKCVEFADGDEEGCTKGESCGKLHIYHRKLSLEQRVKQHGRGVLDQVKASRVTRDALLKVRKIETELSEGVVSGCSSACSTADSASEASGASSQTTVYTHNPYSWE